MSKSDLDFAANCTQAEGWISETREDLRYFSDRDRDGCFTAFDQWSVDWDLYRYALRSFWIYRAIDCDPLKKRGMGLWRALLYAAIEYLKRFELQVYLPGRCPTSHSSLSASWILQRSAVGSFLRNH